jgi:hypothetical protein
VADAHFERGRREPQRVDRTQHVHSLCARATLGYVVTACAAFRQYQ